MTGRTCIDQNIGLLHCETFSRVNRDPTWPWGMLGWHALMIEAAKSRTPSSPVQRATQTVPEPSADGSATATAARLRNGRHWHSCLCVKFCVRHLGRLRAVFPQAQPDGLHVIQERGCWAREIVVSVAHGQSGHQGNCVLLLSVFSWDRCSLTCAV